MTEEAAIVGIGATEFSKRSGRSELRLAVEATMSALDDCGLSSESIDGMVTMAMDSTDEIDLSNCLGTSDLNFFARTPYGGGGATAAIMLASLAIASGRATVVLCYRAMNERSGVRLGQPPEFQPVRLSWYLPFGLATAASRMAIVARRYMHDVGATSEDFGRVAVLDRKHAANNPTAWFYGRPISLEDHQASRMICDPLRLLDCCQESDGAVAILVTDLARARNLKQPLVVVKAAAQGASWDMRSLTNYYRSRISDAAEMRVLAAQLWSQAGIKPTDIDVANMYDHFTPAVLMQLEAMGFCGRGEAADFVKNGELEVGGRLPLNTNGGQLGEAYIHGYNGIAEAVRQVRGSAVNQVSNVRLALVTSGSFVPTSGLVLGAV